MYYRSTAPKTRCPRDMRSSTAPTEARRSNKANIAMRALQRLRRRSPLASRRANASPRAPSSVNSALAAWNINIS